MKHRPPKLENVLEAIRNCIEEDRYTLTTHALIRKQERKFDVAEVIHVLKTGYEEKKKTCFDDINNT